MCLFKKFEDEDRARLSWIGGGLERRALGVGVEGGQGRGAPKVHLTTLGRGQGSSVLRTFHSWLVCEFGRGLEGELLSGMQGPSPQGGARQKVQEPTPDKKLWGGPNRWAV